jgi:hypothetical protein
MKRKILLVFLLIAAAGGWYAYREYNRKPGNALTEKTDFQLSAEELVASYEDENTGNEKFLNKYIEVTGEVEEISVNENATDILLSSGDPMSGVNVHLLPEENEKAKGISAGQTVTLKGKCNGKLSDIELNAGIILKP